jgi:hypothetical protein
MSRLAAHAVVGAGLLLSLGTTAALAQQTTGAPGSPDATMTIDGRYLPNPPPRFGGEINPNALQSKPYWPARVVPPQGAPNVLLIMTDDTGFGAGSTFGGVIPMPTLDRLAGMGLRYTNMNSTALCSPSRAALITGRNHHTAGFGVVSEQATGFPGYDSFIGKDVATIGEILKQNGYATSWFGKDHNTPAFQASQAGPFDQWPTLDHAADFMIGVGEICRIDVRLADEQFLLVGRERVAGAGRPAAPRIVGTTSMKWWNWLRMPPAYYTFDKANANAPSTHRTQYFEMFADRAIYQDGWIASTKVTRPPWELSGATNPDPANNVTWELYDLTKDWTQSNDVAAANPAKLKELQDLFWVEAAKYNVLPLDSSVAPRVVIPKPSLAAGRTVFSYSGEVTGIPPGDAPSLLNTSYTITADIEIPPGGAEGMINTNGGRFGGYGFYLLKDKPVFTWNLLDLKRMRWEGPELLPGKHTLEFDFKYDGLGFATLAFNSVSGIGRSGIGTLKVDGQVISTQQTEHTVPIILQFDETFDVGADTGTPVDDRDYQVPFNFTGKLNKLTLSIDRPKLTPEDIRRLQQDGQRSNSKSE